MSLQDIKKLKQGEQIKFCGILSSQVRTGTFVRIINDHLIEVQYPDHTEHNHILNIFK